MNNSHVHIKKGLFLNINKTDKHIHTHKKRYLEVIKRFTRFKEFNGEKKTATKIITMTLG
jgi:hypothetical protein